MPVDNLFDFTEIKRLPIDFEEIMELLKHRIQSRLPNTWQDFLLSNTGVELLEAVAYEATLMFYQMNATLNEAFLPTAKTDESVYKLARQIGYSPYQAKQSYGKVVIYVDNQHTKDIIIPAYTVFSASNGSKFYNKQEYILSATQNEITVDVYSGVLNEDVLLSTGVVGNKYQLTNYPVNAIEYVTVNGKEYTGVDFIDVSGENYFYILTRNYDGVGYISFGDDTYGVNPDKNSTIRVKYITGVSKEDNVASGVIDTIVDNIYDTNNVLVTDIHVVNIDITTGAIDKETNLSIKQNAPAVFRTQNRCVTKQDYKDLVMANFGISKMNVLDNSDLSEIGIYGTKLCAIPSTGGYLSDTMKNSIMEFVNNKKTLGTIPEFVDPSYIAFDVNVTVTLLKDISRNIVENNIKKVVNNYLHWTNRDFGDNVVTSEIYRRISSIEGVNNIINLTVEESRQIYVKETPLDNVNKLKIFDSMNVLDVGSKISIFDNNQNNVFSSIITDITDDVYTFSNFITSDMGIVSGSVIYPVFVVSGNHTYGTKKITIGNLKNLVDVNVSNNDNTVYAYMNVSYLTVYFSDDISKQYKLLYRLGNDIYLSDKIDRDIPDGTEMYVINRTNFPVLSSTGSKNSSIIVLQDYPRFDVGATLTPKDLVSFDNSKTLNMSRSSINVDYLTSVISPSEIVKVSNVYSATDKFTENIDYTVDYTNYSINWTVTGQSKISPSTPYYVDIIRKVIKSTTEISQYYVKAIDGKNISISPSLSTTVPELTEFMYDSDAYRLLDYEIATVGTINISFA